MSTPVKDNDQILSDQQAFMASYERARTELGRLDGVVGVAFGLKRTGGTFSDDIAIIVYVSEKKSTAVLPPGQQVPATFDGYRTDVRTAPSITDAVDLGAPQLCDNDRRYELIQGGIEIQTPGKRPANHPTKGSGTLGCIVKKRGDKGRDNVYLLTCKHVLADNGAGKGDKIYHPLSPDNISLRAATDPAWDTRSIPLGPIDTENWIQADSVEKVPGSMPEAFVPFYLDAAIARIEIDSTCCFRLCVCKKDDILYDTKIRGLNLDAQNFSAADRDRITDVRDVVTDPTIMLGLVSKVGRTTGRTFGKVTAIGAPYVRPGFTTPPNVIEIILAPAPGAPPPTTTTPLLNCQGTNSFGEGGDSGSIVVDEKNEAIGLLFGLAPDSDPNTPPLLTQRFMYASHIVPVLDHLGIRIPTTKGTKYGCAGEAEGWTPGPPATSEALPGDPGKVLFAGANAQRARTADVPDSATITSEQHQRVLSLRDAFRETEHGRELDDTFAQLHREIAYLVNHRRPVTVTWHRNRGPAFLACVLNHLRGDAATVPQEIGGISRATLLTRMGEVLLQQGSNPLRRAIERHRDVIMLLADAATAEECLDVLRRLESAEVTA